MHEYAPVILLWYGSKAINYISEIKKVHVLPNYKRNYSKVYERQRNCKSYSLKTKFVY